MKDLTIHGEGLDQNLPLQTTELVSARKSINEVIDTCIVHGDPQEAFDYGKSLIKDVQIKGVELAHLIYRLHQEWERFGLQEALVDRIVIEWGLHKGTVQKYLSIEQEVLENELIPAEVRDQLAEKSTKMLTKLVRPARAEAFTEDEWHEVAMLPDEASIRSYVDSKIGKSSRGRPTAYNLSLYEDGTLVVFGKNNERVILGVLRNSSEDMKNELRRKAISDIIERNRVYLI